MPIVIQWPLILVLLIACLYRVKVESKVFERCELARVLFQRHHLDLAEVAQWVCIAKHSSGFNTAAEAKSSTGGSHGLFQISDVYWCSPPGQGAGCNLSCQQLRDDNISDDLFCIKRIYDEHQRISGDGYTAWKAYQQHCKHKAASYIQDCFSPQQKSSIKSSPTKLRNEYRGHFSGNSIQDNSPQKTGKVYGRCELARELHSKHEMPMKQIPTWVCIAEHESRFNTAAVGRLNADGSADHGLFQISDLFWCSHERYSGAGKACGLSCSKLLDNDITDDVHCIKQIHSEHTALSGDGFSAWTVYEPHCQNQRYEQISNCFQEIQQPQLKANAYGFPVTANQIPNVTKFGSNKNNPFFKNSPAIEETKSFNKNNPFFKQLPAKTHYIPPAYNEISKSPAYNGVSYKGKVYTRCSLAQELYFKHHFPIQDIATWVCIAEHISKFNTSALGHSNSDGSTDLGLFQISDRYWCDHTVNGGKACNLPCHKLMDEDLQDDVACIKTIYQEHNRLSGDGFNAWPVYQLHCQNQAVENINICFEEETLKFLPPTTLQTEIKQDKGKIYNKCELAQELYRKHNISLDQISKWVCIAQHESSFNTAAVGRLNADGSADHGLFQISDLYWCNHDQYSGKACNIPCHKLLDSDITDDVKCIKQIHEEHTRISGDGFNAWTVYQPHCLQIGKEYIKECFTEQDFEQVSKQTPTNSNSLTPKQLKPPQKAKVYQKCELAQELFNKQRIPMEQVATWVCIAEHVSSYNTAAVGHLNTDGSLNHGIFQISDLYWCSHDQGGGKACNIPCENLLDADLKDDIRCIRIIYEEHSRISGNGFDAWPVYKTHCRSQKMDTISSCFLPNQVVDLEKQQDFGKEPKNTPYNQNPFLSGLKLPFLHLGQNPLKPNHFKFSSASLEPKYSSNPFLQNIITTNESESHESIAYAQNYTNNTKQHKQQQNEVIKPISSKEHYQKNPFLSEASKTTPTVEKHQQIETSTKANYRNTPSVNGAGSKLEFKPVEILKDSSSVKSNTLRSYIKSSSVEEPNLSASRKKSTSLTTSNSGENVKTYLNSNDFRTTTTTSKPKTTSATVLTTARTTAATTEKSSTTKLTVRTSPTTHKPTTTKRPATTTTNKRVTDTETTKLAKVTTTWSWINEKHSTKSPTTTTKSPTSTHLKAQNQQMPKNANLRQAQGKHFQSFTTLNPLRTPTTRQLHTNNKPSQQNTFRATTVKPEKTTFKWAKEQKSATPKPLTTVTENWRKWDKTTTNWNSGDALKSTAAKPITTTDNWKKWVKVTTEKQHNGRIKMDGTTPNWANKPSSTTRKSLTTTENWRKSTKSTTKSSSNNSSSKYNATTLNFRNKQTSTTTKPVTSTENWRKWDKATTTTTRKVLQSTTNNWRSTTTIKPTSAKTTKTTTTTTNKPTKTTTKTNTAKPTRFEHYKLSTTKLYHGNENLKATTLAPQTSATKPRSHKIRVTTPKSLTTKANPTIHKHDPFSDPFFAKVKEQFQYIATKLESFPESLL